MALYLEDLQPCGLLGDAGFGLGAAVILRPILTQENGWGGLLQYPYEKGHVGGGVEVAFLPVIKRSGL
jgi:hypothetical protein